MTATQTAVRESLYRSILNLPDEKIGLVERYVNGLEGHEPSERTVKAIEESLNPANLIGPFYTVESLMDSLLAEDDA